MKNLRKLAMFYDTSFFSEANINEIKEVVSDISFERFVTKDIYNEIICGYKDGDSAGLKYICENNFLKDNFKKISFDDCEKNDIYNITLNEKELKLKQYPILCSAYYRWLPFALEPFFLANPYKHIYNSIQYNIKDGSDLDKSDVYKLMGNLVTDELNKTEDGKMFNPSKLRNARKKKRREYKDGRINLNDYKLCLSAFIYACYNGISTTIITCDYDLKDIILNIYESMVEQYVVKQIISEHIKENKFEFNINRMRLVNDIEKLLNEIKSKPKSSRLLFTIMFYDKSSNRVFPTEYSISSELAHFFIKDKQNLDCYSLNASIETYNNYRYKVKPSMDFKDLFFKVTSRVIPFYEGFVKNCSKECIYCEGELNPLNISTFIKEDEWE